MRYSNLHTHSIYSDGLYTIEENILKAIELNFVSIGMSDHSHVDKFDCMYGIRSTAIQSYHNELARLKEKYKDQIEVYCGIELEGFSEMPDRSKYDYIIGDNHYVIGLDGKPYDIDYSSELQKYAIKEFFNNDPLLYAEKYFDLYCETQKKFRPDILGHFDLIAIFNNMPENDPKYKAMAIEALRACLKVCPLVEVNIGAIAKGLRDVPYPTTFILEEILAQGGKVMLSSDCHDIKNLNFHFDQEVERLKSLGFKSIVELIGGKFVEVGI